MVRSDVRIRQKNVLLLSVRTLICTRWPFLKLLDRSKFNYRICHITLSTLLTSRFVNRELSGWNEIPGSQLPLFLTSHQLYLESCTCFV